MRSWQLGLVGALVFLGGRELFATAIPVTNGSFEAPYLDVVSPYATSVVEGWEKAAVPDWWLMAGYSEQQWAESAGTFVDVPFAPVANIDGRQAFFMFAPPGMGIAQDLSTTFEIGQTYRLTAAIQGGGFGMPLGTPMEIRLYYRDDDGNRVTVGAREVKNTNATGSVNNLTDYWLDIPDVKPNDAWAGKPIGIQLISTAGFDNGIGYWDIDNIRLTANVVPEPVSLVLVAAGMMGITRRGIGRRSK